MRLLLRCVSVAQVAVAWAAASPTPSSAQRPFAIQADAYADSATRSLVQRSRIARAVQDSAIRGYVAVSRRRISLRGVIGRSGRERLIFRRERAARIEWQRELGATVTMLGARSVAIVPAMAREALEQHISDNVTLPYFPGQEPLWVGGDKLVSEVDAGRMRHPLSPDAERYYRYALGDLISLRLPDGTTIPLREMRVTARAPRPDVIVGSFWFDVRSAQLVRATYRVAAAQHVLERELEETPTALDDVPLPVRSVMRTLAVHVEAVTIEYGLQEQRFWLPRLRVLEAVGRVSIGNFPIRMEEVSRYESVNATPLRQQMAEGDSGYVESERYHTADGQMVRILLPTDTAGLRTSPELPESVYDESDAAYGGALHEELRQAPGLTLQPGFSPQRVRLSSVLPNARFNRIEGLSLGAGATWTLGAGFAVDAALRLGHADRTLNARLALQFGPSASPWEFGAFRRLVASIDYGQPLSFGASVPALLFARDEGFYHRSSGVDLVGGTTSGRGLSWRLFRERQSSAKVESRWSLLGGAHDDRVLENPEADNAQVVGGQLRWQVQRGLGVHRPRATAQVRVEGGSGSHDYLRALVDVQLDAAVGPLALSLAAASGGSIGQLPTQRMFVLGGLHTVRGVAPGTGRGDSFWLTRSEVGFASATVRPVVFADIGWAGESTRWRRPGRPLGGVGSGISVFDGLLRLDVARGFHPKWQTRVDLSIDARF